MYTTKVSFSESTTVAVKSFFLINSNYWMIGRVLTIIYNLYLKSWLLQFILTLRKVGKQIPDITSKLISAHKKIRLIKRELLSLSSTYNGAITIPKLFSLLLSIFLIATLVMQVRKPNLLAKLGCIALIILLESITSLILNSLDWVW